MIYGYARVWTNVQSVAAQAAALRKHRAGKVVPRSGERLEDRPGAASPVARSARHRRTEGCYACRTRVQLRRGEEYDFTDHDVTLFAKAKGSPIL